MVQEVNSSHNLICLGACYSPVQAVDADLIHGIGTIETWTTDIRHSLKPSLAGIK